MGKKNLDRLFQEKLKDFTGVPDDKVWQAIEASLDKKESSRKIIPIWWKLGGVAAVLIIGVFLWNPLEDTATNSSTITDVNTEASEENNTNQTIEVQKANIESIVNAQRNDSLKKEPLRSINQVTETDASLNKGLESKSINKQTKRDLINNQNVLVTSTPKVKIPNTNQSNSNITKDEFDNSETAIVESKPQNKTINESSSIEIKTEKETVPFSEESLSNQTEKITQIEKTENEKNVEEESKKKSIFDEIAEQEDEKLAEENSTGKWSVGPNIAPVYFNAIGEGSSINSAFVPNSKSGDVNLSYGLSIAYEVNKKLSIRSGINKVDYGYRTNDIEFSSLQNNTISGQISNIDYTNSSKDIIVNSVPRTTNEFLSQDASLTENSEDVIAESKVRNGTLEQQFGYLEMPVELKYVVVDKRFGINLIGGVSSLFLIDNSISLNSGDLITEVGKANNINSVNFSTNVGFGVNYKFSSKVQLNIEPMFKYQLNTFSTTDGSFNPFSIGIYSGMSFKF